MSHDTGKEESDIPLRDLESTTGSVGFDEIAGRALEQGSQTILGPAAWSMSIVAIEQQQRQISKEERWRRGLVGRVLVERKSGERFCQARDWKFNV